jgi:hypothetical protein
MEIVMDEWLVRTSNNQITGPYSREQIREMILQAKLKLEDEICGGNQYWIFLHENQEVKNQLGIEIPNALYTNRQEGTQTQTDTEISERTDPQNIAAMGAGSTVSRAGVRPTKETDAIPDLIELEEELGENTAVMSNRAFRDYRQRKVQEIKPMSISGSQTPMSITPEDSEVSVERSKLAHYIVIFLMSLAVIMVLLVIKLLRQQQL